MITFNENKQIRTIWQRSLLLALTLASWSLVSAAEVDSATLQSLQNQIKTLTEEVEKLKEGPPRNEAGEDLLGRSFFKAKGLSLGFYGEVKYRFPKNGANTFDPHRFVLLPSYQINDWLVFNSELELEHGGLDEQSSPARSRFDGELELEQFYVDILLHEHFNIRSLGIDVVPMGRINKYHEPTLFYSTERPELYREIIPSTWSEPSLGFFGKITETLDYQLMLSTGMEDSISGSPAPGINSRNGLRGARPRMRNADENNLAYSGRLHYNGFKGLDTSASFYATTLRGATGKSTMAGGDVEALYRPPGTGLELRGDLAYWRLSDPQVLVANNDDLVSGGQNNVGDTLYGWYAEAAYHFWPEAWKAGKGKEMDLVPFLRYSAIVTQSGLANGIAAQQDGTANKDYLTAGISYFLNANFVVKADWRRNLKRKSDEYFQLGAGMFF